MTSIYILSAARTPIGKFQGSLATVSAPMLGGIAIKEAIARASLKQEPNHVIMGNVLIAGIGQAPARQAAHHAGLTRDVGAITLGKVCGSGMRAIMDAHNGIVANEWQAVVAGGMESMSNVPYLLPSARTGARLGHAQMIDAIINDGLWDPYHNQHMGSCAELCAKKYLFTREAQDAYALVSYRRAQSGQSADEIAAVDVAGRKETVRVTTDEEPFAAPLEKITTLRPAFDPQGTVTAANASKINDGAAALVLSNETIAKTGKPLARIVATASHAQEPQWFTTAPIEAIRKALAKAQLRIEDIGLWEINEAFAVVTMAAMHDLNLDPERVNVRGGAVAMGHPIGASGARIVVTLLHALRARREKYGCAAICIGGGEATAIIVENLGA